MESQRNNRCRACIVIKTVHFVPLVIHNSISKASMLLHYNALNCVFQFYGQLYALSLQLLEVRIHKVLHRANQNTSFSPLCQLKFVVCL